MADPRLEELEAHITGCSICNAANKHVNDFCDRGRFLFFLWEEENPPLGAEVVDVSKEEYERLVEQDRRRRRAAERN